MVSLLTFAASPPPFLPLRNDQQVLEARNAPDEVADGDDASAKGTATVVLDATIFYAKGGGQPSDVGTITSSETGAVYRVVEATRNREDGTVTLAVEHEAGEAAIAAEAFPIGSEVEQAVDWEVRTLHSRIHSAGHLIDKGMQDIGATALVPTKGLHYATGSYVQYDGDIAPDDLAATTEALQAALDALVDADVATETKTVPRGELEAFLGEVPDYIPETVAMVRVVSVGGMWMPCGGTHVDSTGVIGRIRVKVKRKKEKKKRVIRVSYTLDG